MVVVVTFLRAHSPRPSVVADCPVAVCWWLGALLLVARCHVGMILFPSHGLYPRLESG